MELTLIGGDQPVVWTRCLDLMPDTDFYHSHGYHLIEAERLGGVPLLAFAHEDDCQLLLPLLIREIPGSTVRDATSVYGYPGLLGAGTLTEDRMRRFVAALDGELAAQDIVSLFVRLHPVLSPTAMLRPAATVVDGGATVSIDLTLTSAERRAGYRSNHRRDLKKLQRRGYSCRLGAEEGDVAAFADLYHQTMRRVDAASAYFFELDYFRRLLRLDGLALLLCEVDGQVAAGAVVSAVGTTAQYHLGGTRDEWLADAPMKLVFDQAAEWAMQRGAERLHLGGGLGAHEDALFNFKAGFSSDRHQFSTWRHIVQPDRYHALVEQKGPAGSDGFFPAYRAPSNR